MPADLAHYTLVDLTELDARAVAPALYSFNVHDSRTGELVGKYAGHITGDWARDRRLALVNALRDADESWNWEREDFDGPPSFAELVVHVEHR